jgi:hypothetical protein
MLSVHPTASLSVRQASYNNSKSAPTNLLAINCIVHRPIIPRWTRSFYYVQSQRNIIKYHQLSLVHGTESSKNFEVARKFTAFIDPERFIPYLRQPTIGLHLESFKSNPHLHPLFFQDPPTLSSMISHVVTFLEILWWNFFLISFLHHAYYMFHTSHPPWFDNANNIWWRIQIMKFLTTHVPILCYFITLRPK